MNTAIPREGDKGYKSIHRAIDAIAEFKKANPKDPVTRVIFRVWKAFKGEPDWMRKNRREGKIEVIALFPEIPSTCNKPWDCQSYEHVGQHGAADPIGIISRTRPAKPEEYADLLSELRHVVGYDNLKIVKKFRYQDYQTRKQVLKEMGG